MEQLERSSSGIAAIEQRALAARQEMDVRITSLERSVSGLRQMIEQQDRQFSVSDSVSSGGASAKPAGRVALDLRAEEIARDLRQAR